MTQPTNSERVFYVPIPEDDYFERMADAICRKLQHLIINNNFEPKSRWLTHGEAAVYVKKSPAALYKISSEKQIKYSKRGKQNYYRQEDLDAYMEDGLIKTSKEIISETKLSIKRDYNQLKK